MNRILWNVRGDDIDEIVLHDATVHIEQMNDRCWWIGITLPDGGYWAGNFTCDSRGRMRFWEQEMEGFDWDEDRSHEPGHTQATRRRHSLDAIGRDRTQTATSNPSV